MLLPEMIRQHFGDFGAIALSQENQTQIHLSNFLVGFKGKLYEILIDFQINEIPEYDAIGSGSSFAFGSLYNTITRKKMKPEQRIKKALETAAFFDLSTAGPFIIEKL